jgi:hypothetical protein
LISRSIRKKLETFNAKNIAQRTRRVEAGVRITTRQLAKCEYNSGLASKNTNPLARMARFFSPITDPFYIFGQLFSDMASENAELYVLKKLSAPLVEALWGGGKRRVGG